MEYAIKRKSDGTLWTSTIDNSIVRFKTLKEAYAYAIRMNLTYDEFEIWDIHLAYTGNPNDFIIKHSDPNMTSHICRLYDTALCAEHGKTIDNARLIAAAPELLEACQEALDNLRCRSETRQKWTVKDQKTFEMLKAAIAKAEGR